MFGFGKKKKEQTKPQQPKKQSNLDKILMGVVLGGAIGSVLGVGLAPKKGADTRKDISKQANKIFKGAKDAVNDTASKLLQDKKQNKPEVRSPVSAKNMATKRLPEE